MNYCKLCKKKNFELFKIFCYTCNLLEKNDYCKDCKFVKKKIYQKYCKDCFQIIYSKL